VVEIAPVNWLPPEVNAMLIERRGKVVVLVHPGDVSVTAADGLSAVCSLAQDRYYVRRPWALVNSA
jgi:hypothetical protein